MVETVHSDYEVSSEGAVRHWTAEVADLSHATPTPTNPARLTGLVPGIDLCGTVLTTVGPVATPTSAVLDVTSGMVYRHDVIDIAGYAGGGAANAWLAINIGDPVYYDASAPVFALGAFLSLSPLEAVTGFANTRFGWVVPGPLAGGFDTDAASFPQGTGLTPSVLHRICVMQRGAGG
jgi:hypothetical protein